MRKFFVDDINLNKIVSSSDYNHIVNVLRNKTNDIITIFDNKGIDYLCQITNINKKFIEYKVLSKKENYKENSAKLSLFQASIKPQNLEIVIQKCTELNVDNMFIFPCEFSNYKTDRLNLGKLNKLSIEACKQCERSKSLDINFLKSFDDMVNKLQDYDLVIFAYEKSEISFKEIFAGQKNVAVIVGPEGGFSLSEVEKLRKLGNVKEVLISKNILRSETASIALCSVCMYELN